MIPETTDVHRMKPGLISWFPCNLMHQVTDAIMTLTLCIQYVELHHSQCPGLLCDQLIAKVGQYQSTRVVEASFNNASVLTY